MKAASIYIMDDLPQMWQLDVEATAKVLQALWNYYAAIAERALAHKDGDTEQENLAYLSSLVAWEQLFICVDKYVNPELAGAWRILLKEEREKES